MTSNNGDELVDEINIEEFAQENNYVAPAQKSVQEILSVDQNDESLKKYKDSLLGGNSAERVAIVDGNNPLNAIFTKLSVVSDGEIKHSISLPANDFTIAIKEGSPYKIQFEFYVQREIITGLKYLHKVSRMGVGVAKDVHMLGSYGPRHELYVYNSPVEEAPQGMLSRGKYRVRSLLTDDDKHRFMEWTWTIEIAKDWQ